MVFPPRLELEFSTENQYRKNLARNFEIAKVFSSLFAQKKKLRELIEYTRDLAGYS
jgi:hypothetical protein